MDNAAKQLLDLLDKCQLSARVIALRLLDTQSNKLKNMAEGKLPIPPHTEETCIEICKTLQAALDKGKLPVTRDELAWAGIIHILECEE